MRVGGATDTRRTYVDAVDAGRTLVGTILTIGGPVLGVAQPPQAKSDAYTCHGEFMSFDTAAKTITVKSRVAYQDAISELKHFKAGDRVGIVWSGIHDSD
jgi:hypothetical protein